ncbi:MAG: hypothetical protein DMG15_29020 [Acidobacteria bacterium]|nr:MAG: hypothetical protein DMG16_30320 [Acidobacteriota bacterium]PYS07844.1 MAG: hypothetical protein DMG15_29020 [Acidobacteriota bacterium]
MSKKKRNKNWDDGDADLADLIEEITVDAYTDDEKLWAFRQVIEDEVDLPRTVSSWTNLSKSPELIMTEMSAVD